jgi:hypothetical protein
MRKRFVWFLLFSTFGLTAQNNLILNPSCEDASQIPDNLGGYPYCINWWNPFIYTTDYFTSLTSASNYNFIPNSSFGYQKCIEGNYFLGIVLLDWYNSITDYYHFRADYAGGNFSDPLIKNNTFSPFKQKSPNLKPSSNSSNKTIPPTLKKSGKRSRKPKKLNSRNKVSSRAMTNSKITFHPKKSHWVGQSKEKS